MGEDARDYILNIVPFVLRFGLVVVYVDEKNRGEQEMQNQQYSASTEDFKFEVEDGLNMHNESLCVFLKTGHYDVIYREKDFKNKELRYLGQIDEELNAHLNHHRQLQNEARISAADYEHYHGKERSNRRVIRSHYEEEKERGDGIM